MKTKITIIFMILGFTLSLSNQFAFAQGAFFKTFHGRFVTNEVESECSIKENGVLVMRQRITATLLERLQCDETSDVLPEGTQFEARLQHAFDCRFICERDELEVIDEDGENEEEKQFVSLDGIGANKGEISFFNPKGKPIARGQIIGLDFVKTATDGMKCFVVKGTIYVQGRNNQQAVLQYRFDKCGFPEECRDIKDAICNPENWRGIFGLHGVITKSRSGNRPPRDIEEDDDTGDTDDSNNTDDTNDSDDSNNSDDSNDTDNSDDSNKDDEGKTDDV